ncbi:uncharacterized protein LOC127095059 [Lathyrus oleraceus]|uniref:uncharacterized protein LOC127095059 n=1 Tax=Pisum sativum TaxID=3888 RepID=UPI0021D28E0D|nr:uncharacterized protein LOC127095059 [Pisum sativum]
MVGGRNKQAIIDALEAMDQALQGQQNQAGDEFYELGKFRRNNSLTFKGIYDPEGGHTWLREINKIFRVMACTKDQKVLFGTHMLSEDTRDRWDNARHRMEGEGTEVSWALFKTNFLEKYFPEDVRSKKETEFLCLK